MSVPFVVIVIVVVAACDRTRVVIVRFARKVKK